MLFEPEHSIQLQRIGHIKQQLVLHLYVDRVRERKRYLRIELRNSSSESSENFSLFRVDNSFKNLPPSLFLLLQLKDNNQSLSRCTWLCNISITQKVLAVAVSHKSQSLAKIMKQIGRQFYEFKKQAA